MDFGARWMDPNVLDVLDAKHAAGLSLFKAG